MEEMREGRKGESGGKILRGCAGLPCTARRVIELSSRALLVVQGGFRGKALFLAANALFQPGTMTSCVVQRG